MLSLIHLRYLCTLVVLVLNYLAIQHHFLLAVAALSAKLFQFVDRRLCRWHFVIRVELKYVVI